MLAARASSRSHACRLLRGRTHKAATTRVRPQWAIFGCEQPAARRVSLRHCARYRVPTPPHPSSRSRRDPSARVCITQLKSCVNDRVVAVENSRANADDWCPNALARLAGGGINERSVTRAGGFCRAETLFTPQACANSDPVKTPRTILSLAARCYLKYGFNC